MARRRSNQRRKTGRPSVPPSLRMSKTPPPVEAKVLKSEVTLDGSGDIARVSWSGSHFGEEDAAPSGPESTKKAVNKLRDKGSSSEDDTKSKPAKDAQNDPAELKKKKPGAKPREKDGSRTKPSASPSKPPKAKNKRQNDPDQDERDSDAGNEASKDEGLHDDFFRQGEVVDKEHIAAQMQAAKEPPKLEDTGQTRLVALRTSPEVIARRKKLRRVVAYTLLPAVIITVIAGYKLFNGKGNASAQPDKPVATVTVTADDPPKSAIPVPSADDGLAFAGEDLDADAADAEVESIDAALDVEAEASATAAVDAEAEAAAEGTEDIAEGVDVRKEALVALNQAKWERAEKMAALAIATHPEDATLYLYRGTALQEMGKRTEAKAVFKQCVESAKRGPINECRVFAR